MARSPWPESSCDNLQRRARKSHWSVAATGAGVPARRMGGADESAPQHTALVAQKRTRCASAGRGNGGRCSAAGCRRMPQHVTTRSHRASTDAGGVPAPHADVADPAAGPHWIRNQATRFSEKTCQVHAYGPGCRGSMCVADCALSDGRMQIGSLLLELGAELGRSSQPVIAQHLARGRALALVVAARVQRWLQPRESPTRAFAPLTTVVHPTDARRRRTGSRA